jgi:hypothetical protein
MDPGGKKEQSVIERYETCTQFASKQELRHYEHLASQNSQVRSLLLDENH